MIDQRGLETISDDGYRRIRSDIIFGKLRPEQRLRLEALRDTYGVSVSTLREILSRLSSEGLVLAEGRRGFEVAPVPPEELKELAELRLLLECHAMERRLRMATWNGKVASSRHTINCSRLSGRCRPRKAISSFGSATMASFIRH